MTEKEAREEAREIVGNIDLMGMTTEDAEEYLVLRLLSKEKETARKCAEIAENYGDIALLMSQTQKHLGSQATQKGIAIAGERIAEEILNHFGLKD